MTILCGTDLSAHGADAIVAATAVARARGDRRLIVAHVAAAGTRDATLHERRAQLDALAATAGGPDLDVTAELLVGEAAPALITLADTEGADLIVVASKGHTGAAVVRLGGTSERIAVTAAVPVLIVRDAAPLRAWSQGERPLRALVGVDESASCDAGAAWLARARATRPIDVTLAAVYYADVAARRYGLPVRSAVDADPEVERLLTRDLSRRFAGVGGLGALEARPTRGLGRIADHLLERAEHDRIDLIVVGTSQTTGLGRLGSVSAGVVHEARQSILCLPPSAAVRRTVPPLRVTMVATDLSEFANCAVPYALAIAPGPSPAHEVHIVHVVDDDAVVPQGLAQQLRELAPPDAPQAIFTHVVHGGDPATTLAETAARLGADVICIASHGRSGVTRALVGSVADRLLRETRLPVLVLRPKLG
ncbi:MAG: universal stress protein [Kofleriaceae bacterium]